MKNIILIGMPASGKTTIGSFLSKKINFEFIDTDLYLEKKENKKIKNIFIEKGERYFRNLETKYLKELSENKNCVICTGGGIVKNKKNIEIMKKNGIIIFLDRKVEDIIRENHSERPLLQDINNVYKLYKERINLYLKYADIVVKNDDILDKVVEKVNIEVKNYLNVKGEK